MNFALPPSAHSRSPAPRGEAELRRLAASGEEDAFVISMARQYGYNRHWSEDQVSDLSAKWRSALFEELTGIKVHFPKNLSLTGAASFVLRSYDSQWKYRHGNKNAGVDVFINNTFGDVLATNCIPVSLIAYTDIDLYDRICRAHANNYVLPKAIIYDISPTNARRPIQRYRVRPQPIMT